MTNITGIADHNPRMAIDWSGEKFATCNFHQISCAAPEAEELAKKAIDPTTLLEMINIAEGLANKNGFSFHSIVMPPNVAAVFVFKRTTA